MILITGASSGIGEACARQFAARGRDLILVARRLDRLESLARELRDQHSVQVHCFELNVTDFKAVSELVASQPSLFTRVDTLINNAGLGKGLDPIQSGNPEDWDVMIDTNIKGLLYVTRVILPLMIQKKRGHLILMGSVAGRWTYPRGNVYSATKYAVKGLTESLRLDLLGTGIRVTEIAPGMVETGFSEVRLGDAEKAKAVYAGMTPLTANDIADAVVWAEGRPQHVNIQEIVIYPTDQASPSVVQRKAPKDAP
ncbi:MAG: SDR family NAD(P)-dependent oxidoreductase [Methylotenera sp.]|nr:SDR family NAD(P)-dependent oxidoreductase [Oligoflexia bacterium]